MSKQLSVEDATTALSEYTKATIALEQAKNEENRLKQLEIAQKQTELELEARRLEQERQTENRRDARINELIDTIVKTQQRNDDLTTKLVTTDDSFGETVGRIIQATRENTGALIDVEKAVYALLTKEAAEIESSKSTIKTRHQRSVIQDELLMRMENLSRMELQAAGYGSLNVPTKLANDIQAERDRIEELEERLK